jgi:predicted metal-dependent hydrolase
MKKTVIHPIFGEIAVQRTARARRILLAVRPPGKIRLTLPALVSERAGMAFVEEKREWLAATLRRMESANPVRVVEPPYRTVRRELVFVSAEVKSIKARISGEKITVSFPAGTPHSSPELQGVVHEAVTRALRAEAKEFLPPLADELARRHGLHFRSVAIRASRRRWGSCSSRNDISLSLFLMTLPRHLIEYVIVHELCHTRHKNHSPQFHALLDSLLDGHEKQLAKELRTYRTEIL